MNNKKALGSLIRAKRKAIKMTQKDLASKIGKVESTVRMWELGKNQPSPDALKKLATTLNMDYIFLLREAGYLGEEEYQNELNNRLAKQAPAGVVIDQLMAESGKTEIDIVADSSLSFDEVVTIQQHGTEDIEKLNSFGKALGIENLYELLKQRNYEGNIKSWWKGDLNKVLSEEERAARNEDVEEHKKIVRAMATGYGMFDTENGKESCDLHELLLGEKSIYYKGMFLDSTLKKKVEIILDQIIERQE